MRKTREPILALPALKNLTFPQIWNALRVARSKRYLSNYLRKCKAEYKKKMTGKVHDWASLSNEEAATMTDKEIAACLGCSTSAVRMRKITHGLQYKIVLPRNQRVTNAT